MPCLLQDVLLKINVNGRIRLVLIFQIAGKLKYLKIISPVVFLRFFYTFSTLRLENC